MSVQAARVTQVVELWLRKYKSLSSNPSAAKKFFSMEALQKTKTRTAI
jgi:hypothetical protein